MFHLRNNGRKKVKENKRIVNMHNFISLFCGEHHLSLVYLTQHQQIIVK